jgi:DNA-binding response OmpR family regulator
MRILIVMPDPGAASALVHSLLVLGHEPAVAEGPEVALLRLRHELPDVILLDIDQPGMGGRDFLRLPRVREAGVPVIAMAEASQLPDGLEAGAADVLEKPVRIDDLGTALAVVQARARRAQEGATLAERRRAPRAAVVIPVTIIDSTGRERAGRSLDLSSYGIKIWCAEPLDDVTTSELVFRPPDGGELLRVLAVRVRKDRTGHGFAFLGLTEDQTFRLASLVRRLTS